MIPSFGSMPETTPPARNGAKPGVNQAIFQALKANGPCTKSELVFLAGSVRPGSADSTIYRAIKQMLKRGLLVVQYDGMICVATDRG